MTSRDELLELVDRQAEDEGLWFVAETAPEAYLQQELRRLHAAVEGLPTEADVLRRARERAEAVLQKPTGSRCTLDHDDVLAAITTAREAR